MTSRSLFEVNRPTNSLSPEIARSAGNLRRIHEWLGSQVDELTYFVKYLSRIRCIPGNGGDISVLIPEKIFAEIANKLSDSSLTVSFPDIPKLAVLRKDLKSYYRAQGIEADQLTEIGLDNIGGRAFLVTSAGAKLWDMGRSADRRLCIVRINDDISGFEIVYGHSENGSVPTTEFTSHLIGHASNLRASSRSSSVMHVHPQHVIDFARHPRTQSFDSLNRILYTQRPELFASVPELVGTIPFKPPGSRDLFLAVASMTSEHRAIIWRGHGIFVRSESMEKCVDIIDYVETSSAAALRDFALGLEEGVSRSNLERMISSYDLPDKVLSVFR